MVYLVMTSLDQLETSYQFNLDFPPEDMVIDV